MNGPSGTASALRVLRIEQDARAGSAFERPEVPPDPGRQPGVEEPVAPPWAGMLDQQPMADRRGRAGEGFLDGQAPERATVPDRGHGAQGPPRIVSNPSRTRRRTRTARLAGSRKIGRQLADRELGELVQVRDPTHRRLDPRRHLEPPVPEEHDEAIGPRRRLADGARATGDDRGIVHRDRRRALRDRPTCQLRPVREESLAALAGLRQDVDLAERRGERREPPPKVVGESLDVLGPSGGHGLARSPRPPARRRRSAPRARASRGRRR